MLKKCDFRLEYHFPYNKLDHYGSDWSRKVTYEFNSLGYRGEEYTPNAKKIIYVAGCSWTFGTGLNYQDTWPHQFKQLLTKKEQLTSENINLLNFGVGGGSNDYITRILMTQSHIIKPDFILANFTFKNRWEYLIDDELYHINIGNIQADDIMNLPERYLNFINYYTDEMGIMNTLKNMLLLQFFCKHNKIDYIFSYIGNYLDKKNVSNPICNQFIELLDTEHLCDFWLEQIDNAADEERDIFGRIKKKGHPWPNSNKVFAEKLFTFYDKKNHSI